MLTTMTTNGIMTLSTPGPPPYTAALVFGAGARDETVRTTGVAHLVEHLVMAAQRRTALDTNAMVDDVVTVFHASGQPQAVADWLADVCAAVRELPLDRMQVEAKVLDVEQGEPVHPALAWAAGARFGASGVGMLGRAGAPHGTLTKDHVTDFVRRHLTADNAVLVTTGEPPDHPGITLPAGPRPVHRPVIESSLVLPAYLCDPPVPIVSWVCERTPAAQVLLHLLTDVLTDEFRHQEGLVYEIGSGSVPVSPTSSLAALWADDGAESDQHRILRRAVELLRGLAAGGPEAAALDHQRALARAQLADPRATSDFLVSAAHRHLEGRPVLDLEEAIGEIESVTAEQVRAVASTALPALLLGGGEPAHDGIAGIPDRTDDDHVPECPSFDGRRWRRKLVSTAPRDLRLDIGDEGIAQTALGERHGDRWSEVVGVARGTDFRAVVFHDGGQLVIWPSSLKDGAAAVEDIDRRAGELVFDVDEEWL